ncbi:MAG: hypothetical protein O3C57_05015 [Verrucomicrobia bacterium]|nr:hypothetical protein [Verrucomicrobiota bacterium]
MNSRKTTFVGLDIQGDDAVLASGSMSGIPLRVTRGPSQTIGSNIGPEARVAVAMPPRESVCRWLETPFSSFGKARKVLPTLLDIQLPFPLDECVYVFVTERKSAQGKVGALAAAARHPSVAMVLSDYQQRGVDPTVLDHEGLALWTQASVEIADDPDEVTRARAVIYAGVDRACIALGRGNLFLNSHACSLDNPVQVLRLLRATLGDQPGEILWVWSGPRAGTVDFDASRQAIEDLAPGPSVTVEQPHAFLARALCRRLARPGAMACNFRSGPFVDTRHTERLAGGLRRLAWVLLLLGGLLWGSAILNIRAVSAADHAASKVFSNHYQRVTGKPLVGAKGAHAITMARRALDEKSADLKLLQHFLNPSLTIALQEVITEADTATLQIHECLLSDSEWRVTGLAKDRQSCEALKACAQKTGLHTVLTFAEPSEPNSALPFVLLAGGGS